eukprot:6133582-Prymnesium_polylepis.1
MPTCKGTRTLSNPRRRPVAGRAEPLRRFARLRLAQPRRLHGLSVRVTGAAWRARCCVRSGKSRYVDTVADARRRSR